MAYRFCGPVRDGALRDLIAGGELNKAASVQAAFKGHTRDKQGSQALANWLGEECSTLNLGYKPEERLGLDFAVLSNDSLPRVLVAAESEMKPLTFPSENPWDVMNDFVKLACTPASKLVAIFRCNDGNGTVNDKLVPKPELARKVFERVLADEWVQRGRRAGDEAFILILYQGTDPTPSADAGHWSFGGGPVQWVSFTPK